MRFSCVSKKEVQYNGEKIFFLSVFNIFELQEEFMHKNKFNSSQSVAKF